MCRFWLVSGGGGADGSAGSLGIIRPWVSKPMPRLYYSFYGVPFPFPPLESHCCPRHQAARRRTCSPITTLVPTPGEKPIRAGDKKLPRWYLEEPDRQSSGDKLCCIDETRLGGGSELACISWCFWADLRCRDRGVPSRLNDVIKPWPGDCTTRRSLSYFGPFSFHI